MRILGVDPGMANTGLAILDGDSVVWHHTIKTDVSLHDSARIESILMAMDDIPEFDRAMIECPQGFYTGSKAKAAMGVLTTAIVAGAIYGYLHRSLGGKVGFCYPATWMRGNQYARHNEACMTMDGYPGKTNSHVRDAISIARYAQIALKNLADEKPFSPRRGKPEYKESGYRKT